MNNISSSRSEWADLPPDPSFSSSESKQSSLQSKSSMQASSQSESISKSSPLMEARFSPIPGLIPPQAIRFSSDKPEETLRNVLDSTIEAMEETLNLLSDDKFQALPFIQQAQQGTSSSEIPIGKFASVILAAMRELKKVQKQVESDYAEKSQALRIALSDLSSLHAPSENISKLILMSELLQLKNQVRYISTGKRVILGEHPDIMLKLVEYGIIPPTVIGGPYDGMAKKLADQGKTPYDNPAYAAMAKSLPAGWEELSIGELDVVISQLQESMTSPLSDTSSFSLLSTVLSEGLFEGSNLLGSFTRSTHNLMQMLTLRMQLETLKTSDRQDDLVMLGHHPELLATLLAANSAPNPYLEFGNPNFGMAQKAAIEHTPPYDNPVYATIALSYPPGWESLSLKELDKMIQQLDKVISQATDNVKTLSIYSRQVLIEPLRSSVLNMLALSQFSSTEILPFGNHSFLVPPSTSQDVANMLLDSVAMFQSFYWNVHPLQFLNPNQMGEHLLGFWLTKNISSRLTEDLYGYQITSPFEREMMTQAIVSYALVGTLINTYRMTDIGTLNVLNSLAKNDRFAIYTGIAIVMIENFKQDEIKALQSTIRALTKQVEENQEQLENIKTLEALLKQMLAQIFQMLVQNANGEGIQGGQTRKNEPPPFVNLQG